MTKSEEIMKTRAKLLIKNFPKPLKDGERAMWITPGFEARDPNPSKDYGIGGCTVMFAERRGDLIIDCTFMTDWYPTDVQNRSMSNYHRTDVIGVQPLCSGMYFHNMKDPTEDKDRLEWMHTSKDCYLTGGYCIGEAGSALYGDKIRERLINEGSVAVWDEIDHAFKEAVSE